MASRSSRKMAAALMAQKKLAAKRKAAQTQYPQAFSQMTNAAAADAANAQVPPHARKKHKRHYS